MLFRSAHNFLNINPFLMIFAPIESWDRYLSIGMGFIKNGPIFRELWRFRKIIPIILPKHYRDIPLSPILPLESSRSQLSNGSKIIKNGSISRKLWRNRNKRVSHESFRSRNCVPSWTARNSYAVSRYPDNRGIQMASEMLNLLILSDFLFYWVRSKVRGEKDIIIGDGNLVWGVFRYLCPVVMQSQPCAQTLCSDFR